MEAHFTADDVSTVPASSLVEKLPFRLNGEKALDQKYRFSISIGDTGLRYRIELRNGIAEVSPEKPGSVVDIEMDSQTFRLFYIGVQSLEDAFNRGLMTGDPKKAASFFSLFDWPNEQVK